MKRYSALEVVVVVVVVVVVKLDLVMVGQGLLINQNKQAMSHVTYLDNIPSRFHLP